MRVASRLLLVVALLSGCAYFNTFYHAKQAFSAAERIRERAAPDDTTWRAVAAPQYERAIQKASKVLTFHPNSKYADDAVMLIGLSYFWTGDWLKAERKFRELVVNFPQSSFSTEAYYRLAAANYELEREREANEALLEVLSRRDEGLHDDARLLLARIASRQDDKTSAVRLYEDFLMRHPRSDLAPVARLELGRLMMDSGEYAPAREVLVSVGDADGDLRTEFDAKLGAARCLLSLGRAEQALSEFETLSRQERFYGRSGEAEVWVGRALSAAGRNDEAAEAFESVADEHPGTREAGEALVALGDLCRDVLGDLDRAAESYGRVKNTSGVPDSLSLRAQESAAEIARLQAFWEALADSARAEQAATDRFRLAETYLYDFGWSDSARHEFITLVEDQPESPLAPRALLSVAGIDTETGDTTSALTLHRRIVQEYPRSDEAGDAWLLLPPDERPVRYDAGDLYDAAVELYTLEDYNSVREYCDSLVAQYPGSRYVVKALFLSARAAERIFGGADSTAFLAYTEIASEHPWTPEGKLASAFIGRDTLVSVGRGREVLSDSLLVVLDSTGRGQSKSAFPNAPPVTDYGELRMPDVEGLRYSNVVTLKIIIDAFGHVTAAEIIGSSGERDVDDAVVEAVLATVFNVKEKQPEDLQTWFTFRVDIDEYLDIQQKTRD